MKQPSEQPAKKPYQSPKLLVYGDLIQMTKASGNRGRPDGGKKLNHQRSGGG
jgi:hypothetical protein